MNSQLVGQKILVGLTYLDVDGEVREQKRLHGVIAAVGENTVAFERADGAGRFSIPFDGELDVADPEAIYTLRSTEEAISGVNFVASFTIIPPNSGEQHDT